MQKSVGISRIWCCVQNRLFWSKRGEAARNRVRYKLYFIHFQMFYLKRNLLYSRWFIFSAVYMLKVRFLNVTKGSDGRIFSMVGGKTKIRKKKLWTCEVSEKNKSMWYLYRHFNNVHFSLFLLSTSELIKPYTVLTLKRDVRKRDCFVEWCGPRGFGVFIKAHGGCIYRTTQKS